MNHTKEPWRVGKLTHPRDYETVRETVGPHEVVVDTDEGVYVIAGCNYNFPKDAKANARRIVACVNACAGIDTAFLEVAPLEMFKQIMDNSNYMAIKQQNDDLLLEVESLKERLKLSLENEPDWIEELRQHARGTLGKACEQRDELQKKWDYYQEFCKAQGANGITDLLVQRDKLLEAITAMLNSAAPEWETESGIAEYSEAVSKARSSIASAKGGAA